MSSRKGWHYRIETNFDGKWVSLLSRFEGGKNKNLSLIPSVFCWPASRITDDSPLWRVASHPKTELNAHFSRCTLHIVLSSQLLLVCISQEITTSLRTGTMWSLYPRDLGSYLRQKKVFGKCLVEWQQHRNRKMMKIIVITSSSKKATKWLR